MNLFPLSFLILGYKSTLCHCPVFGEYYTDSFHYHFGTPLERLRIACKQGKTKEVIRLIHSGLNVDTSFNSVGCPLQEAALYGQYETVTTLIALGADVNKKDKYKNHLFKNAIYGGNLKVVDILLTLSKDSIDFNSAFRTAVSSSHKDIAAYFLNKGVDINWVDDAGYTVLIWMSDSYDLDMIKFLVEHGADLKIRNKDGDTPMLHAARHGYPEGLKYFLDKGSPIEDKNYQGQTALLLCSDGTSVPLSESTIIEKYQLLLSRGADINARDKDSQNIFDGLENHPKLVEFLQKYKSSNDKKK